MEIVTGDRYFESLVKFVEKNTGGLLEGTLILKLNPVGLHYVQSRLEALSELEGLIAGAPVDYLRAYVSDLGDHRALEQLRRILCRLTSLKIVSVLPFPSRDPTPLSLVVFGRLKVLELRGCDLSSSTAKGLLELRHTLEKLICHNSTDALRHVFASRIADIRDSSQWNRLSFVSCACNGLILMDESLQLLPALETLDLSRNKFAKVDNLRKCVRLRHLDLGFNQLRSVESFIEVTCHILKLVLRNNALTTLQGIENLKSLEELDVSYNVISNYVELEVFSSLPSLKDIWLEGNPLCCTRWYRPQVFSFFLYPEQVKLDDRRMRTREFWKRQIIIARRHRRPASYGFYCPAREENEVVGFINGKRKKYSRLACIESDEPGMNMFNEQDSLSCIDDIQGGEEDVSDNEGELTSLINRIEFMKKERSKLWVEEFKDWIDQGSENWVDENKNCLPSGNSKFGDTSSLRLSGECSRYLESVSDSIMNSGDGCSGIPQETNSSFASSVGNPGYQWLHSGADNWEKKPIFSTRALDEDHMKFYFPKGKRYLQNADFNLAITGTSVQDDEEINAIVSGTALTTVKSMNELKSSPGPPLSPPHYEEDILYRRYSLEEEILQVSAESFSAASSDSNTSDEDDRHEYGPPPPQTELYVDREDLACDTKWKLTPLLAKDDNVLYDPEVAQGSNLHYSCVQQSTRKLGGQDNSSELSFGNGPCSSNNDGSVTTSNKQHADWHEVINPKRKPKKRVVSLSDSTNVCRVDGKDGLQQQSLNLIGRACENLSTISANDDAHGFHDHSNHAVSKANDHIESYFSSFVADTTVHETCKQIIVCNCVVGIEPLWSER
ncbi:Serine/threonine-protein kinase 11-interacting protein [Bienertia sinuspersici]